MTSVRKVDKSNLGVGCFDMPPNARKYLNQVSGLPSRISYGPYIQRFEKKFSAHHGAKFGIMVNSGTSALRIAVACLKETEGWQEGDEVLGSSRDLRGDIKRRDRSRPHAGVSSMLIRSIIISIPAKIEEKITSSHQSDYGRAFVRSAGRHEADHGHCQKAQTQSHRGFVRDNVCQLVKARASAASATLPASRPTSLISSSLASVVSP
jgi:hypothetical protein